MAFIKTKSEQTEHQFGQEQEQRLQPRDMAGLLEQLGEGNPSARRWAARDLSSHPDAAQPLCQHLLQETEQSVREAIFDSMLKIGGATVVEKLLPLLHSDDASLRNGAIEVLQDLPEEVSPRMQTLLHDPESDVRIFAIDILQVLAHPDTPKWLLEVLDQEQHINVLATAVDRLAEVGTPEMVPKLLALKARFPDQSYIAFAVDTAIRRIGDV